jgi:hypothetical protein
LSPGGTDETRTATAILPAAIPIQITNDTYFLIREILQQRDPTKDYFRGEWKMPITNGEAKDILERARGFYKHGAKSTNKVYISEGGAELTFKQSERWRKVGESLNRKEELGQILELGRRLSWVDFGGMLLQRSEKTGNCPHMSAVTAYFANEYHGKEAMTMCVVQPPGNHVFLSVGVASPQWQNIASMKQDTSSKAMIIDCWANIACRAQDYPQKMTEKLLLWSGQRKYIYNNQVLHEPTGTYRENMLNGKLSFEDPWKMSESASRS